MSVLCVRYRYIHCVQDYHTAFQYRRQSYRWLASFHRGRRKALRPRNSPKGATNIVESMAAAAATTKKVHHPGTTTSSANTATATSTHDNTGLLKDWVRKWLIPVRYRFPQPRWYSREHGLALAQRLPWFVLLAIVLSWDETSPLTLIRIRGPSMLPTMAADGHDVWLCQRYHGWLWNAPLRRGDLVGFAPPVLPRSSSLSSSDQPDMVSSSPPTAMVAPSCKRIVGLPGDVVQRYGQYVHLYVTQDPKHWGISWPTTDSADAAAASHEWIDPSCPWDDANSGTSATDTTAAVAPHLRTLEVPPGHVWLEADCPALGLDSRQMGPIPMEWIQAKVVARLWPLGRASWNRRPHPMRLDRETLLEHNVHRS
jgi:signal peptidase I